MDKRKNKIFLKRAFSLMLSAVVLFIGLPLGNAGGTASMESKVAVKMCCFGRTIRYLSAGQVKTADFISQMWKVIRQ